MNNKFILKISCILSVLLLIFLSGAVYAESKTAEEIYGAAVKIADYEKSKVSAYKNSYLFNTEYLKNADSMEAVRILVALSRMGYSDDYNAYGAILTDIVKKDYLTSDKLDSDKASPWHTISLGLMACKINPQDIKAENGKIDLIRDGVWKREKTKPLEKDGLESLIRGLITLDAYNTMIPESETPTYTRDDLIKMIMSYQEADGSFRNTSVTPKPEIAAMVITALAPYKDTGIVFSYTTAKDKIKKSKTTGMAISEALSYLSSCQTEFGDYSSFNDHNVRITARVITALCSLGLDPMQDERFIKNGNNLVDALLSKQNSDGSISESSNKEKKHSDNSFALEALSAYYRFSTNQLPLYNFTDYEFYSRKTSLAYPNLKKAVDFYGAYDAFISTDNYEEAIILIDKAEQSKFPNENDIYLKILKSKANELFDLKQDIIQLNELAANLSNPQIVVGTKNSHEMNMFIKNYNNLKENEKAKITYYDDVIAKKNSLGSKTAIVYIFIGFLCIVAILFVIFIALFFIRSTPLWDYIYMRFSRNPQMPDDEYDFDDEDYELYEEVFEEPREFSESNLPYVDNDEFFDYDYPEDEVQNEDFKIY